MKALMYTLRPHSRRRTVYLAVPVILLALYAQWALHRPLPPIPPLTHSTAELQSKPEPSRLAWPLKGQAAVGIVGGSILEVHGTQTAAPIASAAKLITALTILHDKPLKPGQQGPVITLRANDVATYNAYVAQHGSVVPVASGEQISQYQVLQAIMLPSANNMADSLAIWAYGSLAAYAQAANKYVANLGLSSTHIGSDASGLAPNTTSTAADLAKLGEIAMQNPVLAQIVGQSTASGLPIVSTVKNVNFLLGTDNIIGIKTGNTDEAGGVFVSASKVTINNQPVTLVTAVVGESTLFTAMKSSLTLVRSAQANFKPTTIVKAGTVIGSYQQPWGGRLPAIASKDFTITTWASSPMLVIPQLQPIPANTKAGHVIGRLQLPASALNSEQSMPVQLKTTATIPSAWWRLIHPF